MTNEIVQQQSFKERIINRIRDNIGELMTDDELSAIVERAMEEIFFKPILVEERHSNRRYDPPFIHQFIKKQLEPQVKEAVGEYIRLHQDEISEQIAKVIEGGMAQALINAMKDLFSGAMLDLENNISDRLRDI